MELGFKVGRLRPKSLILIMILPQRKTRTRDKYNTAIGCTIWVELQMGGGAMLPGELRESVKIC